MQSPTLPLLAACPLRSQALEARVGQGKGWASQPDKATSPLPLTQRLQAGAPEKKNLTEERNSGRRQASE